MGVLCLYEVVCLLRHMEKSRANAANDEAEGVFLPDDNPVGTGAAILSVAKQITVCHWKVTRYSSSWNENGTASKGVPSTLSLGFYCRKN